MANKKPDPLTEQGKRAKVGMRSALPQPNHAPAPALSDELVLTQFSQLKARPVEYLVPARIPSGKLTLIAGRGGTGKSTIIRSLVAALSSGRPAFGLDYRAVQGKVLMVAAEDDPADTILPSLIAERADLSRIAFLEGVKRGDTRKPFSLQPDHVELMRQRLLKSPDIALITIDPIASFVGRAMVDDHRATELRLVLDPLGELAAKTGAAILLLAHLNKGSGDAVDRISGSAAYRDAVRCAYLVTEDPEDATRRLLMPIKENLPGFERTAIPFNLDTLSITEANNILMASQFSELNERQRDLARGQLRRVRYEPCRVVNANEVIKAKTSGSGKNKVQACAEWVTNFLQAFAYPSDEIVTQAKLAGFTFDNVKQAKTALKARGLQNSNLGRFRGVWWSGFGAPAAWKLRPEPSPDTHYSPLSPFSPESPRSVLRGECGETRDTRERGAESEFVERDFVGELFPNQRGGLPD